MSLSIDEYTKVYMALTFLTPFRLFAAVVCPQAHHLDLWLVVSFCLHRGRSFSADVLYRGSLQCRLMYWALSRRARKLGSVGAGSASVDASVFGMSAVDRSIRRA
jgi:hypothetical protein